MSVVSAGALPDACLEEAAAGMCGACGAIGLSAFYEVSSIPTQSCVLLDSQAEAREYPKGDLLLAFCSQCGFIQNVRFAPSLVDYSLPTEESQAFSPRFQAFAKELAADLLQRYDLTGRSVLEVGCGKGDFMDLLAAGGIGSGIGIDPGFLPRREQDGGRVRFVRDHYDQRHVDWTADLVVTRHLLEHVPKPGEFIGWLAKSTRATSGAALFTEVPDVSRVLREGAFWDVYYEHCSYFTPGSLSRALRSAGLDVEGLRSGFDDQYILTDARPGSGNTPHPGEETVASTADLVAGFARSAMTARAQWRNRIEEVIADGVPVCLWGGGSKAVAFLTTLGLDLDVTVVDINPHKQGKWLPGTAIRVQTPEDLRATPPGLVIPMNPVYREEIRSHLQRMGLQPAIEVV
ncbi:MAG TPA: class I SAM-dependent methyltransferase [Acidimicrobiia bacterium]|nr:class I SAM-dependent methyltransferase [Acidimicrobiia bacterium]